MDNIQTKSMSDKQWVNEILDSLSKYAAWIAYVGIGLVGKFGWDIVARKKPSGWYILGTGCMGAFVGFITSRYFMVHNPEMGAYVVPIATLSSRDILVFVRMIDWGKVLNAILKMDIKKDQ